MRRYVSYNFVPTAVIPKGGVLGIPEQKKEMISYYINYLPARDKPSISTYVIVCKIIQIQFYFYLFIFVLFCLFMQWEMEMSVVAFSLLLVVESHVTQSTDTIDGYLIDYWKVTMLMGMYGLEIGIQYTMNCACILLSWFPGWVFKALLNCAWRVHNIMQMFFRQWLIMIISCNVLKISVSHLNIRFR